MFVVAVFKAPVGWLEVAHDGQFIHRTTLMNLAVQTVIQTPLCQQIDSAISRYSHGFHETFDLPLNPIGTSFQKRVWQAIQQIPYGETLTYKALAQDLNTSPRAIGQACRANPILLFIPCHRVVASDGLGGYMGERTSLHFKRDLLCHEQALPCSNPMIALPHHRARDYLL